MLCNWPILSDVGFNSFISMFYFKLPFLHRLSLIFVLDFVLYRIRMPETYVVHLGNSKDLMDIAEDSVARRVLREHVRESLGVRDDDLLFAIINSMLLTLPIP